MEQEVKVLVSNHSLRPEKLCGTPHIRLLPLEKNKVKTKLVFHLMGIIQKATKLWRDK